MLDKEKAVLSIEKHLIVKKLELAMIKLSILKEKPNSIYSVKEENIIFGFLHGVKEIFKAPNDKQYCKECQAKNKPKKNKTVLRVRYGID